MKQFTLVLLTALILGACNQELEIQTGIANVSGTQLYYELSGRGEPIVLIHGNYGDLRYWDKQIVPLSKNNLLLRYDVRGFGKSEKPIEGKSFSHSDDLNALLEYLEIKSAHIVGFSMGSGIAGDFVLKYPEKSISFITVGGWLGGFNLPSTREVYADFSNVSNALNNKGMEDARKELLKLHYLNPHKESEELSELLNEIFADFDFWYFLHQSPEQYTKPPAFKRLGDFTLPTLAITAEFDIEACQEMSRILNDSLPNSKMVSIKGTSHIMAMEKPDEFNHAVLNFLKELNN